jgi:hypothetical protein
MGDYEAAFRLTFVSMDNELLVMLSSRSLLDVVDLARTTPRRTAHNAGTATFAIVADRHNWDVLPGNPIA